MSDHKTIKIETRGSMLAVGQCTLIKDELVELTGRDYELVTIKTQGDIQTDKPLWQMEGKDFFTKELDAALLSGEVDCVVHSYKDLGSNRPAGIKLAAITKRQFPLDILLINQEHVNSLCSGEWNGPIVVGTSSPRRIVNIESRLKDCLPGNVCAVETKMLRGNVNTRIEKLKRGEYHAIVLAHAGLERLARGKGTRDAIGELLEGLNFMLLPSDLFPPAASQGALGIECREDDQSTQKLLESVHCQHTEKSVARERERFQSYGGGCHLAVGIHAYATRGGLFIEERGQVDGRDIHCRTFIPSFNDVPGAVSFCDDKKIKKYPLESEVESLTGTILVTTPHAKGNLKTSGNCFIFSAGSKTMMRLAADGVWVNGCSDGRGEDSLKEFSYSEVLGMFGLAEAGDWTVLGPENGHSDLGKVIESYSRKGLGFSEEEKAFLSTVDQFYWNSWFEYEYYSGQIPSIKNKTHCSGLGKTYKKFKEAGIDVLGFPNKEEFKKWASGAREQ